MTVEVINLQGGAAGAGGGDPTLFEDTFLRADQPFLIGDAWDFCLDPNDPTGFTGAQIAAMINCNPATGLTVGNNAGGGFGPRAQFIPRPLSWTRLLQASQFSEHIVTADNSVAGSLTRIGPMIFGNPNIGRCYYIAVEVEIPFRLRLTRVLLAGVTETVLATSANNAFAFGNLLTITGELIGGNVQLDVDVNNVTILSFLDNSGSQLTSGLPGILSLGCSNGRAQTMTNHRSGLLSRR